MRPTPVHYTAVTPCVVRVRGSGDGEVEGRGSLSCAIAVVNEITRPPPAAAAHVQLQQQAICERAAAAAQHTNAASHHSTSHIRNMHCTSNVYHHCNNNSLHTRKQQVAYRAIATNGRTHASQLHSSPCSCPTRFLFRAATAAAPLSPLYCIIVTAHCTL